MESLVQLVVRTLDSAGKPCPYCDSDNPALRETYFDQTCPGCVERMSQPLSQGINTEEKR